VPRTEADARELIRLGQGATMNKKQVEILCKSRSLAISMNKQMLLDALAASYEADPPE